MSIYTAYGAYSGASSLAEWGAEFSIDFVVPLELVSQWHRCGQVADFLANAHALQFSCPRTALSILSTVINELLENAVKFSKDRNKLVTISVRQSRQFIVVEAINITDESQAATLESFLFQLSDSDPETLFFNRLESLSLVGATSGLGLLTVLKDYHADLGVKISPKLDDQLHEVCVTIAIDIGLIDNWALTVSPQTPELS